MVGVRRLEGFMVSSFFLSRILESFSSKNEEDFLDAACNPQGFLLSDASSEPVIEAEVFVGQVASH